MLSPQMPGREPWQDRRSRFDHDWLKNRYLNRLEGFLALLDSNMATPDLVRDFVHQDLPAWERRSREARNLLAAFTTEMTPAVCFNQPPLCLLPEAGRDWLVPLVHRLWWERYPVADWIEQAGRSLDEADALCADLQEGVGIDPEPTLEQVAALRPGIAVFRDSCRGVAAAMRRFPDQVQVL